MFSQGQNKFYTYMGKGLWVKGCYGIEGYHINVPTNVVLQYIHDLPTGWDVTFM